MIEFNRTEGGEDPMGPYAPAGPGWQRAVRSDVTRALKAVEIECPDPTALSERWSALFERSLHGNKIILDAGEIHFLRGNVSEAALTGVILEAVSQDNYELCGVGFRLAV
jgi:hypothetical protein